jgi:hypothetical protein
MSRKKPVKKPQSMKKVIDFGDVVYKVVGAHASSSAIVPVPRQLEYLWDLAIRSVDRRKP